MADTSDLKHMVMSFRVSELQVLLGFAGRNKSGRKQELMQRSLQLVDKGCSTAIHIKIRELYRRRFPPKATTSPAKTPPQALASPSAGMTSPSKNFSQYPGSSPFRMGSSGSSNAPLNYSSKHSSSSSSSPSHNQVPVHPDVRLKHLPFYDVLGELLKPSSLVPRSQSRFQETFFIFHLTPQQAQDIAMSRDTQMGGRVDYTVQIQLRFCLLETSCEQDDNFPPSICVRVNGKMAPLPNPIPTNKPGVEAKRPSRPVNITTICRISPTVPNHISISWASELGRSYCVAVYLVRRLSSNDLMHRLKQNGIKHPDHTRALIKEKLAQDPDSEIVTSSLRVSLACPLGKMRMTVPTRASTCSHLQCFDAPMYLQMNEKKPTWNCPVCDKSAEFDKLFIDGLFTEILRKEKDCNDIKFTEDGHWQPKKEKECYSSPSSPMIQSIEDSPTPKKPAAEQGDVIDLTETDEEDDDDGIVAVAMSVPDSGSSIGSPGSPASVKSTTSTSNTSPSVISTKGPPSSGTSSNVYPGTSGCVSPPVITLDTPPRVSVSPQSLPRSPRHTPLPSPRYSPYSSPLVSPANLSPLGSLHTRSTPGPGPNPTPPPAHSHPPSTSYSLLGGFGLPPPNPYYNFGSQLEPMNDTDLDDFFTSFTSNMASYRPLSHSPFSLNPYGASPSSLGLSLPSSHHSLSDSSDTKDSVLSGWGIPPHLKPSTSSGVYPSSIQGNNSSSSSSSTIPAALATPTGSPCSSPQGPHSGVS